MKKLLLAMLLLPLLLVAGLYALVLYNGPRMKVQQHLRSFQAIMPPLPSGTVPAAVPGQPPPTPYRGSNPLTGRAAELERGRVYYGYYCLFCHGDHGDGHGPVGESYLPVPADLRHPRLATYSDVQLLRASLTGNGHEPVLERVVEPGHRWYLVLYVRSLQGRH